jgi:RNA polymerase sigma-70 factor (ECF subfamily)
MRVQAHLVIEGCPETRAQELVRRMADAKQTLVKRLFAEHHGALQAFFRRRAGCQLEAADLAQEVYLRMLRVSDMNAIRDLESYLFGVASHVAKEHAAREWRRGTTVDVNDATIQEQIAELPSFGGQIDAEQRVKRLREVLRQLPPKCHAAVVLQYRNGLSYVEIAERLGISTHMVKKYLGQALGHCRRRMARLG